MIRSAAAQGYRVRRFAGDLQQLMFGSALRVSGLLQVLLQLIGFFGSVEERECEGVRREARVFTHRMATCRSKRQAS